MASVSILKTPNQICPLAPRKVMFGNDGVTSCRYFDLISDEMYARGRRIKVTRHFKSVFGLLPTTKSKVREASKEDAVPFDVPPEPEYIPPCEEPSNKLERQNAIPYEKMISVNQSMIILPASDFDPHSIRICELVLKGICEINYNDIAALMSLREGTIVNDPRSQKRIPENLEDLPQWRRLQNLVHLS